jgi:hypothetical protein
MPITYYTEAEYKQLDRLVSELKAKNKVLESLRPHWAKGYSSDSVAAQSTTNALNQLWVMLGVSNQTQAVEKLAELIDARS